MTCTLPDSSETINPGDVPASSSTRSSSSLTAPSAFTFGLGKESEIHDAWLVDLTGERLQSDDLDCTRRLGFGELKDMTLLSMSIRTAREYVDDQFDLIPGHFKPSLTSSTILKTDHSPFEARLISESSVESPTRANKFSSWCDHENGHLPSNKPWS